MIERARPRIRVLASTAAERRWRTVGRPHFLNRAAFESRDRARNNRRWLMPMRAYSVSPFLDAVVGLVFFLLPAWALWQATQWLCAPAAVYASWTARQMRRLARGAARWAHRRLWREPAERLGMVVTTWLWLATASLAAVSISLTTGRPWGVAAALPSFAALVASWQALRWWRRRVFRPRALPTRRWRHIDD